mmetsp:Transcript_6567/g.9571  ORF Transcript_6567/g.9571 Transcript_6567/m.9571 type:complete len:207 (+) Transcript_6567:143-763(+)
MLQCLCPNFLGENVVGAYDYNQCYCCKKTCGCSQCTQWDTAGCDGMRFSDPAWFPGSPLRTQFDSYLESEGMQQVLDSAPKRCPCCPGGGCKTVITMAPTLNMQWCPHINETLLHPNGYHVDAFFWITYDSKGNQYEHMVLRIQKLHSQQVAAVMHVPMAEVVQHPSPKVAPNTAVTPVANGTAHQPVAPAGAAVQPAAPAQPMMR